MYIEKSKSYKLLLTSIIKRQSIIDKKSIEEVKNEANLTMSELAKSAMKKYLNKKPSEMAKMNVRDIAMALKNLDMYYKKIISKDSKSSIKDMIYNVKSTIKLYNIAYMSCLYINELNEILRKKDNDRLFDQLPAMKNSNEKIYSKYINNFQKIFKGIYKIQPNVLKESPKEKWDNLIKNIN